MKVILDIYLRSNNDVIDDEADLVGGHGITIPRSAIYIGIIYYGIYYSKLFLTADSIYDLYHSRRIVINQIMLSDL